MLTVDELNDRLIDLAFAEDIGDGDHTTLCCIPADAYGESKLLIKEEGIFAGVAIAKFSDALTQRWRSRCILRTVLMSNQETSSCPSKAKSRAFCRQNV